MNHKSMFQKWSLIVSIMALLTVLGACKKEVKPEDAFVKVYNEQGGNTIYNPLSIRKTPDQGYLILSAFDGWRIQLMKINKLGDFEWKYNLPDTYVNAVPNIIVRGGNYYFVCMDQVGLFAKVMQININAKNANEVHDFPYVLYPTALYASEQSIFLQNYNRSGYQMEIYKLNETLTDTILSGRVDVLDNVEERLVDHITHTGKRMPFFISETPEADHVLMSGFYKYSFSLVFMDENLDFSGVYNGSNYNGGMNAILPLGNSNYALARYSYSNLYFNPSSFIDPTAISMGESIGASGVPEIDASKPVLIKSLNLDSKKLITCVSTTQSNQVLIQFYDSKTGELKGKKYVGQNIPFTVADVATSATGELILLVQATIMGGYKRIATIKIDQEQINRAIE